MLTYFPTPYPDEWWYSVLCRYYVRAGGQTESCVVKELYGSEAVKHGRLFPERSCSLIRQELPSGYTSLEDILLKHTLLPYYMRMAEFEKKQIVLQQYLNGTCARMNNMDIYSLTGKRGPKYCPLCYRRDQERYGEAYWHRGHQIPLMSLCPEHGCQLKQPEVDWAHRIKGFFPLMANLCSEPNMKQEKWEAPLAKILQAYVDLPYWVGPDRNYNNLVWELIVRGYGGSRFMKKGALDTEKLYRACEQFFSQSVMERYFSTEDQRVFYHIASWTLKTPERYALLETLVGLSPDDFFGPDRALDKQIAEQLIMMKESGQPYTKDQVLALLKINANQLDIIAEKMSIWPFWQDRRKRGEGGRMSQLNLCMTLEEKERVKAAANRAGEEAVSAFARKLLMEAIKNLEGTK